MQDCNFDGVYRFPGMIVFDGDVRQWMGMTEKGLDDYIEIAFDGTLQQLKQAFAAIDSAAVYTNEYCNIIGMDISGISSHLGETQLTEFMKNCKRVCEHACVVFFVHTTPNRNEEKLMEKL